MTIRVLPWKDYGRLNGTPLAPAVLLWPADAQVVVAERDGRVVGGLAVRRRVHLEGWWIAPEAQEGGRVGQRLHQAWRELARRWGARDVLAWVSGTWVTLSVGER